MWILLTSCVCTEGPFVKSLVKDIVAAASCVTVSGFPLSSRVAFSIFKLCSDLCGVPSVHPLPWHSGSYCSPGHHLPARCESPVAGSAFNSPFGSAFLGPDT